MRPLNSNPNHPMLRLLPVAAVLSTLLLSFFNSGCVYRIDIQQGNFLDPKAIEQVAPGMTRSQVRYLLGTPLVGAVFDNDRWDYVYYLKRGHLNAPDQRKVTVHFEGDKVTQIERPTPDAPKTEPAQATDKTSDKPAA